MQDGERSCQSHYDDGHSRRAGDRGCCRDGDRARHAPEQRDRHQAVHDRVPEGLRLDGGHETNGRQPVLGHRAHEADVCGGSAGWRFRRRDRAAARSRGACDPRRGRRELQGDGRAWGVTRPRRRENPDPLQRRRAGDGRLRHRTRRDQGGSRSRGRRSPFLPTRRVHFFREPGSPPGNWSKTASTRRSSPTTWPEP